MYTSYSTIYMSLEVELDDKSAVVPLHFPHVAEVVQLPSRAAGGLVENGDCFPGVPGLQLVLDTKKYGIFRQVSNLLTCGIGNSLIANGNGVSHLSSRSFVV